MRTDNPLPPSSSLARVRAQLGRARRWIGGQAASTRWALAITGLASLIVAGYFSLAPESVGYSWIYHGHHFPPDDVLNITKILAAKSIPFQVEGDQIGVPSDQMIPAQSAIEKLNAGPHWFKEYLDEPLKSSFLETPAEFEHRRVRNREKRLEAAIQELDGTLSAAVVLTYPSTRRTRPHSLSPSEGLRVYVRLAVDDDRLTPPQTIQAIQRLLVGLEPELKPDAVTIMDRKGHPYLFPSDPSIVMRSQTRVREEELTAEIAARLKWIEGVQVSVKLTPPPASPIPAAKVEPAATSSVVANAPLALDQELVPDGPRQARSSDSGLPGATGKARILIQVPIEHYKREFRDTGTNREASRDDLMPYVAKTEEDIRSAVAHVVPLAEIEEFKIDKIDVPSRATASASHSESRWTLPWWAPLAAMGAVAVLALAGGGLIVARRPMVRSAGWSRTQRYDLGESSATGPGPSERVRELVRLSPEAAAGVLQRWVGQGGHTV